MNQSRDITLINDLRANPAEQPWLEFKRSFSDPKMIGKLCSAMANSARYESKECAFVLWGIEDDTHAVVGTDFHPEKIKEQKQDLKFWLAQRLKPSIPFSFREVDHPGGRVVILEIPAATVTPVSFDKILYIRIGSATPKLADYPDYHKKLIERMYPYAWEQAIAQQYATGDDVLELLDHSQYFHLTKQNIPDNRTGIFECLEAERIIRRDVGDRWNITNLGAILFATDLGKFNSRLTRKSIRIITYAGKDRAGEVTNRKNGKKGYAAGFQNLVNYIDSQFPKKEYLDGAIRQERPMFPKLAIRELIANALIHQDMTITGAGPQIELFEDRIEISNPGCPLIKLERMIDLPPRSRNEALADLMRRMGICEEQGSGLDKAILEVEKSQLPPPLFRGSDTSMQVILYGPRAFAHMTPDERIRACYQHSVLKFLNGERMKNASLCERFGIQSKNAAQVSYVIKKSLKAGVIKSADSAHPRAGYKPHWA